MRERATRSRGERGRLAGSRGERREPAGSREERRESAGSRKERGRPAGSCAMGERAILASAFLVPLLVLLLTACGNGQSREPEKAGTFRIYYLNSSLTALSPQDYGTDTADAEALVPELMEQFRNVPKDVDNQAALPSSVGYMGYRLEDRVLFLYFDSGYKNREIMDPIREVLCRAALTKTMVQIDGVDYISIYAAEQPLMDQDGQPVGMLTDADFVESISDVNTFERSRLTLYFTDETGQRLVKESREVVHSINTSMERLIVEQLMEGPRVEGHYPTLPPELGLLNVSVSENVCYINFDNAFLAGVPEVNEYVPIYSIVNSLGELSTVSRVQITVNGSSNVMFRDVISLDTQFERDPEFGQ